ncbi:hypothetical protein BN59_02644 [Legionella massiliensis]|uniref:Uncharacterized protein n=1 Tax=Legionella massiliensis TaxID=1034943 RepID=A0A078L2J0_9GAMM|nr:hypothetical protein [Legionella massiliensis]CDZ78334.1 hypothetical protein BN59_02644 [Legionella massiliensis]CEE14072.1 hypothetical protein BN1094_02644 [Legionella massiliensis]
MQSKIENIDLGDLSGEHWKKASLILRNACLSIADEADRQEKLACLDMLETELKNNNSNMDNCCLFFPRNHFEL